MQNEPLSKFVEYVPVRNLEAKFPIIFLLRLRSMSYFGFVFRNLIGSMMLSMLFRYVKGRAMNIWSSGITFRSISLFSSVRICNLIDVSEIVILKDEFRLEEASFPGWFSFFCLLRP